MSLNNKTEKDSRNKAESFWDRTASSYDREERKDEGIHLEIITKSKDYLKPTDTVLDFGCGTGLFSNELAPAVKNIHAIDFSLKMIELAHAKAQKQNIKNVAYLHSTIDDSLQPGAYDVVLSFYILHLLEDPQAAIRKMHTLLKPGGLLISVTPCMGETPFLSGLFSVISRLGRSPRIKSFKFPDLRQLLANERFGLIESELLAGTSNQYFIVSKK